MVWLQEEEAIPRKQIRPNEDKDGHHLWEGVQQVEEVVVLPDILFGFVEGRHTRAAPNHQQDARDEKQDHLLS